LHHYHNIRGAKKFNFKTFKKIIQLCDSDIIQQNNSDIVNISTEDVEADEYLDRQGKLAGCTVSQNDVVHYYTTYYLNLTCLIFFANFFSPHSLGSDGIPAQYSCSTDKTHNIFKYEFYFLIMFLNKESKRVHNRSYP
jgi:hypothetical protein